jgi:hypothetical protein
MAKKSDSKRSNNNPTEVQKVIENLPENEKEKLLAATKTNSTFIPNELIAEKLTEEHLDRIIDSIEKEDLRLFKDAQLSKFCILGFVILASGTFIFLTIFLTLKNPPLYLDIIKILLGFLGGLGVGFLIKKK